MADDGGDAMGLAGTDEGGEVHMPVLPMTFGVDSSPEPGPGTDGGVPLLWIEVDGGGVPWLDELETRATDRGPDPGRWAASDMMSMRDGFLGVAEARGTLHVLRGPGETEEEPPCRPALPAGEGEGEGGSTKSSTTLPVERSTFFHDPLEIFLDVGVVC